MAPAGLLLRRRSSACWHAHSCIALGLYDFCLSVHLGSPSESRLVLFTWKLLRCERSAGAGCLGGWRARACREEGLGLPAQAPFVKVGFSALHPT